MFDLKSLVAKARRPWPNSVEGFGKRAQEMLPRSVFDFVEGGAGSEATIRANRSSFDAVRLMSRVLVDVSERDLSTSVGGQRLRLPLLLAPTGLVGIVHPDGELAAAVAAEEAGIAAVLSTMSTYTIEEIAARGSSPPWLQLYPLRDQDLLGSLINRAERVGAPALCLTVDAAVPGRRLRDLDNGFAVPLRLTGGNAVSVALHPRWTAQVLRHRRVVITNLEGTTAKPPLRQFVRQATKAAGASVGRLNPGATWADVERLRERWTRTLCVKGIMSGDDARRAVDAGADVVIISNHGGRQLDGACGTFEALPEVVAAVGANADVVLDGGVRTGVDVVKALSLGARACMIGRPWLYGLAVGGSAGVGAVLGILRTEIDITLGLVGRSSVAELDRTCLGGDSAHL